MPQRPKINCAHKNHCQDPGLIALEIESGGKMPSIMRRYTMPNLGFFQRFVGLPPGEQNK